jgi:hypothetical protein
MSEKDLHKPVWRPHSDERLKRAKEQPRFFKRFASSCLFERLMRLGPTTRQAPPTGCPRVSGAASKNEHLAPWTQSDHGGRTLHQTKCLEFLYRANWITPDFGIKYASSVTPE